MFSHSSEVIDVVAAELDSAAVGSGVAGICSTVGVAAGGCSGMSYVLGFDKARDHDLTFALDAPAEGGATGRRIDGRFGLGRRWHPCSDLALEALDTKQERIGVAADVVGGELHRGDVEQHTRVGCVSHLGQCSAEDLDATNEPGRAQPLRLGRERIETNRRHLNEFRRHQREESIPEEADEFLGERP